MSNNSVAILVVGLLGFVAIIVTGKWLLDSNRNDVVTAQVAPVQPVQPVAPQQNPVQPPQKQLNININKPYPQIYPHYHNRNEFWFGYRDGYNGRPMCDHCPEYIQGYRIGQHDRHCGRHDYFNRHCPPGFSLRTPGFRLDIK